jgi:hypothetical protein
MKMLLHLLTVGSVLISSLAAVSAAETNSTVAKIGVYDSRAVAYAHFWSAPYQKQLQQKMNVAQAAKKAGDAKFKELSAALKSEQEQNHRQVFSTAPVDDAMEVIKDRLPEIQKQAGVATLVSKWDEATLKKYESATRVDVTDTLVREFITPDEKQAKILSSIENQKPIPLEKCDELIRKGQL